MADDLASQVSPEVPSKLVILLGSLDVLPRNRRRD